MTIKELDKTYIANTYARADLLIVSGKGSLVYDENGKEYIDMGAGIAVSGLGISDEAWKEAVIAQLGSVSHTSNLYYTSPQAKLAQALCERGGMKKVFFSNSGAEANEGAIKAARKYSSDKYGPGRHVIITLNDSFHGRTITTLSATGQEHFHHDFNPFTEGFVHVEPNDLPAMEKAMADPAVCAVLIEIVQGEGGINVLDKGYVQAIAKLAKSKDILLMVDEIQTGNGRTGALFSYMLYDVQPDVATTAKGLGGGLPIGAVLFGEKTQDVLSLGSHGSTFGGNPICAAGALNVISRIDDALMAEVTKKSEYIKAQFKDAPGVVEVTGLGLMLGIKTVKPVGDVLAQCMERGVIVLSAKDKVRLLPALNIGWPELEKAVSILREVVA